ncbi:MarR family winged helix-turn-helix transcriptional regulator [Pelagibacterium sp. 26DY04]|uniref:MarR family winged helix-turn-helix transcriptional regulator n=1 Tax=Pelagibacterium sp. 26DY04 TaxID=2967130 RepID=UPI002814F74D|nr:MarR family winged helix-turn-helix transcriptional regulator [Pelagibacterium sp. 26DY04]WMT88418.1 MarR family winged helix-turn-helix transcriptional regulator [Pelagibacterium sp. 26DY04]
MPSRQETIREILAQRRKDPDLAEALLRIDAVAQNWRRQMHKRELGHRALRALGLDIDLAQVDVLFAIAPPSFAMGSNDEDETMVSTVAERLAIDPSRASRLVAEMVNAGYARRAVSQRDARRAILKLTPAGQAVVDAVLKFKWLLLGEFFSGWSKDDIAAFVPLLERYSTWMRTSENAEEKFADDIAQLSRSIARAKSDVPSSSQSG